MPKLIVDGREIDVNVGPGGAEFNMGGSTVKVDGEGNFVGGQAFGNTFERVDDAMILTRANGTKMKVADDGQITLLTPPKSVGILDLSKVSSYSIQEEGDISVHSVSFADGGHVQVTYHQGQFNNASGHHIQQRINEENEMFVGQYTKDEPVVEI